MGPAGICEACAPGIPAGFKQPQLHKKRVKGWGGQVSLGGVIVWNKKMMKGCFFPLDGRLFTKEFKPGNDLSSMLHFKLNFIYIINILYIILYI